MQVSRVKLADDRRELLGAPQHKLEVGRTQPVGVSPPAVRPDQKGAGCDGEIERDLFVLVLCPAFRLIEQIPNLWADHTTCRGVQRVNTRGQYAQPLKHARKHSRERAQADGLLRPLSPRLHFEGTVIHGPCGPPGWEVPFSHQPREAMRASRATCSPRRRKQPQSSHVLLVPDRHLTNRLCALVFAPLRGAGSLRTR
jgi:hypothetical protein